MSFVLSLILGSTPAVPPPPQEPRTAVFVQPLASAVYALFGAVSASAGAQLVQTDRWSITFDAAFVWGPGQRPTASEQFPGGLSLGASLGASWRAWGRGLNGFFVTPKLYAITNASHRVARGTLPTGLFPSETTARERWNSGEVGLAVDLGFQWTFGSFFIGSVLGIGGGWYLGPSSTGYVGPLSAFGAGLGADDPNRMSGPVLAFNVHLLRVGAAF
ncbi:MAG: hypothetical protein MUC96_36945 [Myxococcaceae bacterium]|nr:hypothetical protein [Myxococcaceae bacterium]